MGKGACSRERRAAKLNLDAPQGTYRLLPNRPNVRREFADGLLLTNLEVSSLKGRGMA